MLFYLIMGLILLMPVLGLIFIGLALRPPYRDFKWLLLLGLLVFVSSFFCLYLKQEWLFWILYVLGPFLIGLGIPGERSLGRRIQAGLSGLGLLLVFLIFLTMVSQMLNHV